MTFPTPQITLSIVVPVYKGGENFRRCLLSLLNAPSPADEIIVVADGEDDEESDSGSSGYFHFF